MIIIDSHMHSSFSTDSEADPEVMIKKAIEKRLRYVCFTDHMEHDYPGGNFHLDLDSYFERLSELKEKYASQITLNIGVELGLQPHLAKRWHDVLARYPFDFVIGSTHVVNHLDPYYPDFFDNRTEKAAYEEYFECVYRNVQALPECDVLGHLDYVVRYGPNRNRFYTYSEHKEIIDEILRYLIEHGIGLEINTSGFRYGLGHPSPHEDVLERYHDLGGEIITIGSDAHAPEYLTYEFTKAQNILKRCGFTYYTYFKKRKPEFVKL